MGYPRPPKAIGLLLISKAMLPNIYTYRKYHGLFEDAAAIHLLGFVLVAREQGEVNTFKKMEKRVVFMKCFTYIDVTYLSLIGNKVIGESLRRFNFRAIS